MAEQQALGAEATAAAAKSDFRRTLGQFPTGVTVITCRDEDNRPVGMTASSFNSVSQEPPLILWSVAKSALGAKAFSTTEHFAVNILGRHQTDIANKFAQSGTDKFADSLCSDGLGGCPILEGTAAWLACRVWSVYEGGDHLIIVGEVVEFNCREHVVPLVFAQSSYAIPVQNAAASGSKADQAPEHGFLENYLLYQLWSVYGLYSTDLYQLLLEQCDIIPEEWRVLTLLLDHSAPSSEDIARQTSQPLEDCRNTLNRMQSKGYLTSADDGVVRLTDQGSKLAEQLRTTALQHEHEVTDELSDSRKLELRQDLGAILATLRQRAI